MLPIRDRGSCSRHVGDRLVEVAMTTAAAAREARIHSRASRGVSARGIVRLIASVAADRPDALAIGDAHRNMTYGELFARALEVADRLSKVGAGAGDLVAVCLPRGPDLVAGALGVFCAGCGYVALDPDQPDARLASVIEDCGATALVVDTAVDERIAAGLPMVNPCTFGGSQISPGYAEPGGGEIAYAVYTSGSTGQPKGVLVEHAGLLNLIAWHQRAFGIDATARCTLIANPAFDASVWEIWPCLTAGASLHVTPEELKIDPIRLRDWLIEQRITVCFLPTPLAETVLTVEWPESTTLRWLLTGGDVLHHRPPPGLPFTVVNNYGVSEATVVSTSGPVSPAAEPHDRPPTIGRAIDDVRLRVVDEAGVVVPQGEPGELLICGPSVARGYLGRPELTAQRFVKDPLDQTARAYRTGDRVTIDACGEVEFLGRLDDQVQIRGFRIELGEITSISNTHSAVGSSVVVPVDKSDGADLVLFVTPKLGDTLEADQLRSYLSTRLPDQMLPHAIVVRPSLPSTPNGKVDRKSLLAIVAGEQFAGRGQLTAPRNDVETRIAHIVAERLKLAQVGIDENFFLLGGHSMLGAQLIVQIAEEYGVELTLWQLFDNPTVAQMAVVVEQLVLDEISAMSEDALLRATADLLDDAAGSR
jgi:amino acid adenylation domain-containing protein